MPTGGDAHHEIMNLLAEWSKLTDNGQLDEFAELLEPDCTLAFEGIGTLHGREAILAYMVGAGKSASAIAALWETGKGGKHLNINPTIWVNGRTASAENDILVIAFGAGEWRIVMCQRQRVTCTYTDRWRVKEKVVEFPYDPMSEKSAAVMARTIKAVNSN